MNDLVNLLLGNSLEETICKIVVFLAIGEFIGALFAVFGNMRR